jgi:hypothetical protein
MRNCTDFIKEESLSQSIGHQIKATIETTTVILSLWMKALISPGHV